MKQWVIILGCLALMMTAMGRAAELEFANTSDNTLVLAKVKTTSPDTFFSFNPELNALQGLLLFSNNDAITVSVNATQLSRKQYTMYWRFRTPDNGIGCDFTINYKVTADGEVVFSTPRAIRYNNTILACAYQVSDNHRMIKFML